DVHPAARPLQRPGPRPLELPELYVRLARGRSAPEPARESEALADHLQAPLPRVPPRRLDPAALLVLGARRALTQARLVACDLAADLARPPARPGPHRAAGRARRRARARPRARGRHLLGDLAVLRVRLCLHVGQLPRPRDTGLLARAAPADAVRRH